MANAILRGVSEAAKRIATLAFEQTIEHPCDDIWDDLTKWGEDTYWNLDTTEPTDDGKDGGDDAADENSAGSYCGPWTAFAWHPDRGGVTLFVNGAGHSQYQSSCDNRAWAIEQCQAALAGLGQ
ncbi:hypothetical protein [Candidatus Poriferisodalis sp.]|uniref:hypothetical protein n=1 Tax=Candidatus Poriferisodalis sp. TaxID=3101277 RepID=UPI003B026D2D